MSKLELVRGYALVRAGYSLALLGIPGRAARPWLGATAGEPGGAIAVRGLAARDLVMSIGVLASARGSSGRVWLTACAISDAADIVATLVAESGALPPRAKLGTVALAGASAAGAAALAATS